MYLSSHLVMEGIDLTSVKELLEHKSLNMTLRYAHLAPEHKANAVRVLEEKLWSSKDETQICLTVTRQ